jgi:hypothetical protein
MNRRIMLIIGLVLLVILIMGVGLAQAQETGGSEPVGSESPEGVEGVIGGSFPVQGRLTTSSGVPLNGTYTITFRLYDYLSDVTPLCTDEDAGISVVNGLFSSLVDGCASYFTGDTVYLGIEVNNDGEMSPRQYIRPVPYALSLYPGAVISASIGSTPMLELQSWGTSGRGLRSYAMSTTGTNYGIVGASRSLGGFGLYSYNTSGGTGIFGWTNGLSTSHPGVFGCIANDDATCIAQSDNAAVQGYAEQGMGVFGEGGTGVTGHSLSAAGAGIAGDNTGAGMAIYGNGNSDGGSSHNTPTLYLVQMNSSGDFVVGASTYLGSHYWRVDRTGKGYFNGGTQASGADFAEQLPVKGEEVNYEPGDVLVISTAADKTVELSSKAFATTVIGVYSTEPGVLAGAPDTNEALGGVPVAVVGIVPCKVSTENGAIQRGDLLVTSSTPGYAMKAGANPPQGTVLGKAMQSLEQDLGVILILVTLQ